VIASLARVSGIACGRAEKNNTDSQEKKKEETMVGDREEKRGTASGTAFTSGD